METTQYITFKLDDELYAIDVSQVREVLDLPRITRVPSTPDYLKGVVNVRGEAIPVVDLRSKFNLPDSSATVHTRVLVMQLDLDGETTIVGGLADSVHHVVEIEANEMGPPPRIASHWRSNLIKGMGKIGDQLVMILDIDRVFTIAEQNVLGT